MLREYISCPSKILLVPGSIKYVAGILKLREEGVSFWYIWEEDEGHGEGRQGEERGPISSLRALP